VLVVYWLKLNYISQDQGLQLHQNKHLRSQKESLYHECTSA
jgi:hypothetical protein